MRVIYKSKHLDIWRADCSVWTVWLLLREFIVIGLGYYRIGICWRKPV